jgi:hypothetical protein
MRMKKRRYNEDPFKPLWNVGTNGRTGMRMKKRRYNEDPLKPLWNVGTNFN